MPADPLFVFRPLGRLLGTVALCALPSLLHGQTWAKPTDPPQPSPSSTDAQVGGEIQPCSNCEGIGCADVGCGDSCGCGDCCCDDTPSAALSKRLAAMTKSLQDCGVQYAVVVPQFYQGVASGGSDRGFEYGAKVDQFITLDSGKLGLWEGMITTIHAESRLGQDINLDAVPLAPVNVAMLYPKASEHDTAITNLTFAQALNEEVQLTFGKFNALDLFYSLYPQTGRGVNGFMNASMVIPISVARVVPLATMGAGALKLRGMQVQGGVLVLDTQNVATTSGFDDMFDNGANILGFWRFFTNIGGLEGSHFFGGVGSTGEFTALDPAGFVFVPGQGIVAEKQSGAYTLLYIAEQALWSDGRNPQRNISMLSAWGLSDEETSPFGWSANIGIQAQGLCKSRPQDTAGIGYFYTGLSDEFTNLVSPLLTLDDPHGLEMYYTAAIAKCFQLTADLQVVEPADISKDTAVVFGLRATVGL